MEQYIRDAGDIAKDFYSRLFILPRASVVGAIAAAFVVLLAAINEPWPPSIGGFVSSLASYAVMFGSMTLIYSSLMIARVFNPKRVVGLVLVSLIAALPAEVAVYRLSGLRGASAIASAGFTASILTAFHSPPLAFALAVAGSVLAFITANYGSAYDMNAVLAALIASVVMGAAYLIIIEARGRGMGYSPLKAVRAFLKVWFTRSTKDFEKFFGEHGEIASVKVHGVILESSNKRLLLAFPSIHYGPLWHVGSASFIYHLMESAGRRGMDALAFHTPGSHEHNLVSERESRELAAEIASDAERVVKENAPVTVCEPFIARAPGGWEAFVLPTETVSVAIIENRDGNDDLPHQLWGIAEEAVGRSDSVALALADAHSRVGKKVTDPEPLKPLINEIVKGLRCSSRGRGVVAGFGEARVRGFCRGLCKDAVKVVTLVFEGRRYVLVYVFGNNMMSEAHDRLERIAREVGGAEAAVIVTPDDHSCAASVRETPYDSVWPCKALEEAVAEAVREAVASEGPARVKTFTGVYEPYMIMSEGVWRMMEGLDRLGRVAEAGILVLALASNVVAPALMLL